MILIDDIFSHSDLLRLSLLEEISMDLWIQWELSLGCIPLR
jgi:hypothetical protein